jgi:5'-nucleotidase (lipoprotein e(P4) family)
LLALIAVGGCRSASPARPPSSPVAPPATTVHSDPDSIRWVRDAAEYRAAVLQTYRAITAHVEAEARARQAGTWAVVLDADETIISNLTYQVERARQGLAFSPESWAAWVKRREATPLPGAAVFLARVRALGGRIAVVTNRLQTECDDTAAVFTRYSLVYDAMLCRPNGSPSDKNPRFEAVARGQSPASASPLQVVAFVGDNILDFPGLSQTVSAQGEAGFAPFGTRFFVIPNPMYGSWQ